MNGYMVKKDSAAMSLKDFLGERGSFIRGTVEAMILLMSPASHIGRL